MFRNKLCRFLLGWDEASPPVWTLEGVAHVVGAARDVDVGIQLQQLAAFQSHAFLELGNCTPKNKHTYQKVSSYMHTTLPVRNEIHAPIFLWRELIVEIVSPFYV